MSDKQKGILFSVLAALAIGLGYIPSRKALESAGVIEVNFVWYVFQSLLFIAIFLFFKNKKQRHPIEEIKRNMKGVSLVGLSSVVGSYLWFYEIGKVGSVNTVFILQFTTVFAVLLGIIILKERFGAGEFVGGAIAILGAFIFFWRNLELGWTIVLILLFNAFVFAVSNLWAKIYIKNMNPVTLSAARVFIITIVFFFISAFKSGLSFTGFFSFWQYAVMGAALSVLGFIFFYKSFSLIEVSKAQLARTPEPLFTMFFSFLILGTSPTFFQLAGGALIVAGVIILMVSKQSVSKVT